MSICPVARSIAIECVLGISGIAVAAPTNAADLIIHGGQILTMVGDEPTYVESLAVDDGKIVSSARTLTR